jgi:heptosyltransferase-2
MAKGSLMPDDDVSTARPAPVLQRAGQWVVYAAFRGFETLLRLLPLPWVFTLGECCGRLAWMLALPYRRLVLRNLGIAFGSTLDEQARTRLAKEHFQRLGANLLSSLKLPTMPLAAIEAVIELEGIEHVEKGIRDNRGFVYAICHMGNWEALAQLPAICPAGQPGALYQPLANPYLNAHVTRLRSRFGFRLFDRTSGFHATGQHVRNGGGLGVLVDQHAGDGGIWCPLFGRLASTTTLGALLTLRAGGPVLPLATITTGRGRWKIIVRPPVEAPRGQINELTAQLNAELEILIRQSPADWFWVHNRWKTPRPNFLLAQYKRGVHLPDGMSASELQPFEILVRTPNWLGDACMALPAVRALKYGRPDARITVLTPSKLDDFWRAVPEVDAVIGKDEGGEKDSVLAVQRRVRASGRSYDVAVLLVDSPRSALEVAGCGIPRIVGYRGRWRRRLLHQIVPPPKPGPLRHHTHHFLDIAAHCGADLGDPRLLRPLGANRIERRAESGPLRVGLCPGAEYGPAKRWPAERFAATARLVSAANGAEWTLLGSPTDRPVGSEVENLLDGVSHRNLIGTTTLAGLMEELATLDLLLTNDTGTMHLAATLGVPVVAVFGSTEPAWTGPTGAPHTVLRHHVPCSPCYLRECPLKTGRYRCFEAITPEAAAEAVLALLEKRSTSTTV